MNVNYVICESNIKNSHDSPNLKEKLQENNNNIKKYNLRRNNIFEVHDTTYNPK